MSKVDDMMIRAVVVELCQSARGREIAGNLLSLLRDGEWLSLDKHNQNRVHALLDAAWGSMPGTTMEALANALT